MKKVLKINWKNLFKFICLCICVLTIIKDFYMLTIYSWINSVTVTWTATGVITFVLSGLLSEYLFEDLF